MIMKQRPRIYYSEKQKAVMWDHWQKGDNLHTIARLFDLYLNLNCQNNRCNRGTGEDVT